MIDKIGLCSHTSGQQEFQKHFGEGVLLVHDANHLRPFYAERCTGGNGAGRGQVRPADAGQRLLSYEFPGREQRNGGLSTVVRNDCEFCAARPKIKDGVSRASLRKEDLLGLQLDDSSSYS